MSTSEYSSRLRALLGRGGLRTGFPRKRRDRWILLHEVARRFPPGERLDELETNRRLAEFLVGAASAWEMDRAALRRALVDDGFLERERDGTAYRFSTRHQRHVVFDLG